VQTVYYKSAVCIFNSYLKGQQSFFWKNFEFKFFDLTAQNDEGEKDCKLNQLQAIHLQDIPKILTWLAFLGQNLFHPIFLVYNECCNF